MVVAEANEPAKGPSPGSFLDDPTAERRATRTVLDSHKLFTTPKRKALQETRQLWRATERGAAPGA